MKLKWRKCPTCDAFTLVKDDGTCGGKPAHRTLTGEQSEPIEGCGQPFPVGPTNDNKRQYKGAVTPTFYPK